MNNKHIIFLIILYCNNMLIGMEQETTLSTNWCLQKTIEGHSNVSSVCVNPKEKSFGVIYGGNQAYIADIKTGKKIDFFNFNQGINSMCFNKEGNKIAFLSYEAKTFIVDVTKEENKPTKNNIDSFSHKESIDSIYFDDNDNVLGFKLDRKKNKINIINLKTDKSIISYNYSTWATMATVSSLGNLLATGSGHNKAHLFNSKTKKLLATFELASSVSALAFDPEERLLAIASRDPLVQLFDLKTNEPIASFIHEKLVTSICFGQSGNILITGSYDGKINIFTTHHD